MRGTSVAILTLAALLVSDTDTQAYPPPETSFSVETTLSTPTHQTSQENTTVNGMSLPESSELISFNSTDSTLLTSQDIQQLRQLVTAIAADQNSATTPSLGYSITLMNLLMVILTFFPIATVLLFFIVRRLVVKDFVEEVKKELGKIEQLENYLNNYTEKADEVLASLEKDIGKHKSQLQEELTAILNRSELSRRTLEQMDSLKSQFLMHLQVLVSEAQTEKDKLFQELYQTKPSLVTESGVSYPTITQTAPHQIQIQKTPISVQPQTAQAYLKQGEILQREQRYDQAIAAYKQATKLQTDFYEAWFTLACLQANLQQYEEALEAYDQAVKIASERYEAWYNRGNTLGRMRRYQESIESFDKAISIDCKKYEAWFNRGSILKKLERYEEAIQSYQKAAELNPERSEIWYNQGNVFMNIDRHEEAIVAFDKALELSPQKREAWCNKGIALEQLQRYQEALMTFEKALKLDQQDAEIWCHHSQILEKLERYSEGLASINTAISIQEFTAKFWSVKGKILEQMKRHEEALAAYAKALEIQPNNPEIWRSKGGVLAELQRYQEAVIAFGTALRVQDQFVSHDSHLEPSSLSN